MDMEVMDMLSGENDGSSGEEFEPEDKEDYRNVNAYEKTTHRYFSKFVAWGRKHGNSDNARAIKVPYKFYLLDCDTCACIPGNGVETEESGIPELPTYRLYGVDEADRSVCCFVQGFKPYFFANPTNPFKEDDLSVFQTSLNLMIKHEIERQPTFQYLVRYIKITEPVVSVEIVANPEDKNILGYHPSKWRRDVNFRRMLKVNCSLTAFIRIAAEVLREGKVTFPILDQPCSYNVYETNLNPIIRFLACHNLSCCSWVQIRGSIHPHYHSLSYAQVEFTVNHGQISATNDGASMNENIPKLRILSFDIECMVPPHDGDVVPREGSEQVLQISNVLRCYGDDDNNRVQVVFTLDTCDPLPDAEVLSFIDEESMLESWRLFVVLTDPDIVTGYNINRFDIPFLLGRARCMGFQSLPYLGRLIELPASYSKIEGRSSIKYSDPKAEFVPYIRGRVIFDIFPVMRQMFPGEASFKLADISRKFLGCTKEDVDYTQIWKLQTTDAATRKRLAEYCLHDSWLVAELLFRRLIGDGSSSASIIQHYCEKARSIGSPLRYIVCKSNKYNAYVKIVRKHKNPNLVFQPVTPVSRKRIASIPRMDKVRQRLFKEDPGENPGKSGQSEDALEELSYENKQS